MGRRVYVVGVGMTKFEKPGKEAACQLGLGGDWLLCMCVASRCEPCACIFQAAEHGITRTWARKRSPRRWLTADFPSKP